MKKRMIVLENCINFTLHVVTLQSWPKYLRKQWLKELTCWQNTYLFTQHNWLDSARNIYGKDNLSRNAVQYSVQKKKPWASINDAFISTRVKDKSEICTALKNIHTNKIATSDREHAVKKLTSINWRIYLTGTTWEEFYVEHKSRNL